MRTKNGKSETEKGEIEDKRDLLEEKMEPLLNEFVANTAVRIEEVEVWDDRTGGWAASIELNI